MKIYLDLLFLVNFICDALILLSTSIILRRSVTFKRLILSSLIGSLSVVILFIPMSTIILLLLKVLISFIIIIVCFKFKNPKYFFSNLLYFFINSSVLGGFIYLINDLFEFNKLLKNQLAFNFIILVIFCPFIIYIYIKSSLKLKKFYSLTYKIEVYIKGKIVKLNGYYDTGNGLKDPYTKNNIIIAEKKMFNRINKNILLVPCNTINETLLLKCFKPDNIYIKGLGFKNNILIGLSEQNINIEGIDCLINKNILEG